MDDLYAADISHRKLIQRYNIFGVAIFGLKQIGDLLTGFFRQEAAYLNVDAPPRCWATKLISFGFFDIDFVTLPAQLKINNVFQHGGHRAGESPECNILGRGPPGRTSTVFSSRISPAGHILGSGRSQTFFQPV